MPQQAAVSTFARTLTSSSAGLYQNLQRFPGGDVLHGPRRSSGWASLASFLLEDGRRQLGPGKLCAIQDTQAAPNLGVQKGIQMSLALHSINLHHAHGSPLFWISNRRT
jgi:hypothetical protein